MLGNIPILLLNEYLKGLAYQYFENTPHQKKLIKMNKNLKIVTGYLVFIFALFSAAVFFSPTDAGTYMEFGLLVTGLTAIIFQKKLHRGSFLDMGFRLNRNTLIGLAVGSAYVSFVLALVYWLPVQLNIAEITVNKVSSIGQTLSTASPAVIELLFSIALMFVLALFGEELTWRGYVLPKLEKVFGGFKAVILCSVLFTLWHLPAYFSLYSGGATQQMGTLGLTLLSQFFSVVPFCVLYLTTRELYGISLIHITIDAFEYYIIGNPALGQASKDSIYTMNALNPTAVAAIGLIVQAVSIIIILALTRLIKPLTLTSNTSNKSRNELELADINFKDGKFTDAEKIYIKAVKDHPTNRQVLIHLGYIALLANRLDGAQKWLTEAIKLKPKDKTAKSLLAEVHYRRDEFQNAAPLFRCIGRKVMADKLGSFKNASPYRLEEKKEVATLKFVMTDPLPVVQVRVNDSKPVYFFIDTGGGEVFLDSKFAEEVGAVRFGSESAPFAGGKATYQHGKVDTLALGDFTVNTVPVNIMDVRRFSQTVFGGTRVDGIIGTVLLYHFISTLDYPKGQLILRRKTEQNLSLIEHETDQQSVPFWMANDHFMVTWGTVNNSQPMLFFVDTGLAGNGFMPTKSTLQKASIKLSKNKKTEGTGGGGKVQAIIFMTNELTLGSVKERNIPSAYLYGMSSLETAFGFHIGGLISHSFFRQYALTIDFTNMRYYLKRKKE
jgi:membrane protease YdiL (CAAX protease family)/predicted aspartyl protease